MVAVSAVSLLPIRQSAASGRRVGSQFWSIALLFAPPQGQRKRLRTEHFFQRPHLLDSWVRAMSKRWLLHDLLDLNFPGTLGQSFRKARLCARDREESLHGNRRCHIVGRHSSPSRTAFEDTILSMVTELVLRSSFEIWCCFCLHSGATGRPQPLDQRYQPFG